GCGHIALPRPLDETMGATWYHPVATLGFLAGVTSSVRLLSHVLALPYHHPLEVAKAFATLDRLSGGRAIVGVGAGHVEGEFGLLGLDFAARRRHLEAGPPSTKSTRRCRAAPSAATAPRPWPPGRCSPRCRSGWADRRRWPSAGRR